MQAAHFHFGRRDAPLDMLKIKFSPFSLPKLALAAPLLVLTAPRMEGRGGRGECDNLLDGKRRARHKISN